MKRISELSTRNGSNIERMVWGKFCSDIGLVRNATIIRPSLIHGNGSFATRDLCVGDKFRSDPSVINDSGMCENIYCYLQDDEIKMNQNSPAISIQKLKPCINIKTLLDIEKIYNDNALNRTNVRTISIGSGNILESISNIKNNSELLRCYGFQNWLSKWLVYSMCQQDDVKNTIVEYILLFDNNSVFLINTYRTWMSALIKYRLDMHKESDAIEKIALK
jgi:hypothetical protein